jgi:hypothetical protein
MTRLLRRVHHRLWLTLRRLEQRTNGEMRHVEDRADQPEWGPLG